MRAKIPIASGRRCRARRAADCRRTMRVPSGSVMTVSLVPSAEYGAPVTSRTLLGGVAGCAGQGGMPAMSSARATDANSVAASTRIATLRSLALGEHVPALRWRSTVPAGTISSMRTVPSFDTTTSIQYRALVWRAHRSTATSVPCGVILGRDLERTESVGHIDSSAGGHAGAESDVAAPDVLSTVTCSDAPRSTYMPMSTPTRDGDAASAAAAAQRGTCTGAARERAGGAGYFLAVAPRPNRSIRASRSFDWARFRRARARIPRSERLRLAGARVDSRHAFILRERQRGR